MKEQRNTRIGLIMAGGITYLLLLTVMAPVLADVESAPFNPPEFYDRIRALRKSIVDEQRENIDLTIHPKYRTIVTHTDALLRVERLTTWFEVNKHNGVVDKVGLLDVVCDQECAFGDLEVTDKNGQTYRQSASKDASVMVDDQNIYLYWTIRFSPVARNGKALPVTIEAKYQLFKLSGLVTVRYKILDGKVLEGSTEIKQLIVRNSPGKLPVNLNIAHSAFFKGNDGSFNDTLSVDVEDLKPSVTMSGKVVAPFWTDGRIGFEALALRETWRQMGPLDTKSEKKRTVVATRDGQRCIDFYFVNTELTALLETGREMACGFAFMPFQRYQPRLPLVDGTIDRSVQTEYLKTGNDSKVIRDFRRAFWSGGIFSTGLVNVGWTPLMYAVTKEPYRERTQHIVDLSRKAELVIGMGGIVNNFSGIPGLGPHPGNEKNAVLPEMLEAMLMEGRKGFTPEVLAKKIKNTEETGAQRPYLSTLSTPEYRDYMLDIRVSTLDVFNVDADYEDLHAHIDVGNNFDSQVEGELRYLEDIALLHEHFGRNKLMIAHAGTILTVADGMNGATWPGEPWSGQNFKRLPLAILDSLLNPFLIGTDVCFYGANNIYDLGSLEMCKQLLRNAVVPHYNSFTKQSGGSLIRPITLKSKAAKTAWQRYFVPGRTFRTDKANFVSWRDPAASSFFTVANPEHKANLYYRGNEAYATCVDLGEKPIKPTLAFNVGRLGFKGTEAFVFDIIPRKLTVAPVRNGWVEYSPLQATAEPVLIHLKEKLNDEPEIIWVNFPVRFEKIAAESTESTAGVTWKCDIQVYPLEHKQELVRVYVGKNGRPRTYISWGIAHVHDFYRDQESMDIIIEIPPATEGGPMGGPCAAGADGIKGKMGFKWDKAFQLSFPYLGEQ